MATSWSRRRHPSHATASPSGHEPLPPTTERRSRSGPRGPTRPPRTPRSSYRSGAETSSPPRRWPRSTGRGTRDLRAAAGHSHRAGERARLRPAARSPGARLVTPVAAVLARSRGAVRRHFGRCPAEPLPPAPIGLVAQRRHRRRRTRSRPARGGVPGSHLLGRAVRLPGADLADAGADAGAAAVPVPAAARRPASGSAGRLPGAHVSLAVRQRRPRGEPAAASQPVVRPMEPRTRPSGSGMSVWRSPTPCGSTSRSTGDLEFLGDYGAEVIVEVARFFAGLAEYDQGRDRYVIRGVVGPGRVPHRLSRRGRPPGSTTTPTRTSWPSGCSASRAKALDRLPDWRRDGADRVPRPALRGTQPLGRAHPPDVRPVPRRGDQPVRGLRAAGRARLGALPGQVRRHPPAGPDPRGRGTTT